MSINSQLSFLETNTGTVIVPGTATSFSTVSGSLQVAGGVGIAGTLFVGALRADSSTSATTWTVNYNPVTKELTTATAGSTTSASGTGTTSTFVINNSTAATSTNTGALQVVNGGAGIGGSAYIGGNLYVSGYQVFPLTTSGQEITATAGQTTFTLSAGYVVGYVQVFANGVLLGTGDYTATNGSTVVLVEPRKAGDVMRFVAPVTYALTSATTAASASTVNVISQAGSATYYPTFVDSNNASSTAESFYTTSSFSINPATGLVTVAAPAGGDGSPAFRITQGTAPSTFNWASSILNSSLSAGKNLINLVGQAESGNNSAYFGFKYVGAGSASNFATIGLYGADNLLNVLANGNVGVGTTSPGYKLVVSGSTAASATTASSILLHLFNSATDGSAPPNQVGIGFGQSTTRAAIVAGTYGNDYIDFFTNGDITTPKVRMRASGAIAFSGVSNYGTSGYVLKSNGDAAPSWVDPATLSASATTSSYLASVYQTASGTYYPTFVDSNNSSILYEAHYTTSTFAVNPATGNIGLNVTPSAFKIDTLMATTASGRVDFIQLGHTGQNTLGIQSFGQSHASSPAANQIAVYNAEQHLHLVTDTQANVNAGTSTLGIFLRSGGNVGIGTKSPSARLHVYEAGAADVAIKITPANGSYDALLQMTGQDNNIATEGFEIWYSNNIGDVHLSTTYASDASSIHFHTRTGASKSTSNERLTILGGGNVGIGQTSPATKLDVSGTIRTEFYGTDSSSPADVMNITGNGVARALGTGAGLTFTAPANTDGSNMWAQARIIGGGDNSSNGDANGALTFQTRSLYNPGGGGSWNWRTVMTLRASGAVSFGNGGTSVGTSGYILKSNGNAAPSWVDPSTVGASVSLTNTYIGYGSGSNTVTGSSNLTWNGTTLYVNGRLQNAGGLKTYSVVTSGQGNVNAVYEIMKISRDAVNWSTNTSYEITVCSAYYTSGGYAKYLVTYGYGDTGTLVCLYASGGGKMRVYLGSEVSVNANCQYKPVFLDIPPYMGASIEVRYNTTEVASVGAINGSGQVFFSAIMTASGGTGAFYSGDTHLVPSGGNLGVGTTSPSYKLSVSGANTSGTPLVQFNATGSGAFQRGVQLFNTSMSAGDSIMYSVGTADSSRQMGQMYYVYAGSNSTSNRLSFGLHSVDDVLNITGNGYVGIGNTGPAYKLDVSGAGNFTSGMQVGSTSGLTFGASRWFIQGESTTLTRSYACGPDTSTYGSWEHYTARSNGTPVSLLRLDATGNVGVGTSSPSYKLDVSGTGRFTNTITVGIPNGTGSGDNNVATLFSQDYSGWSTMFAGSSGSSNGWGIFWAGNQSAAYGTNGTGGPGNIFSNSTNPNELVFVGNGRTDWSLQLYDGRVWQRGAFFCAGDVYSSYSDLRLKTVLGKIERAVDKVQAIETFYYEANKTALELGASKGRKIGVSAQSVKEVVPEVVNTSPLSEEYMTVQYERLVPLLIEATKEQQKMIELLQKELADLKSKLGVE
jgi:hypothetical protein